MGRATPSPPGPPPLQQLPASAAAVAAAAWHALTAPAAARGGALVYLQLLAAMQVRWHFVKSFIIELYSRVYA